MDGAFHRSTLHLTIEFQSESFDVIIVFFGVAGVNMRNVMVCFSGPRLDQSKACRISGTLIPAVCLRETTGFIDFCNLFPYKLLVFEEIHLVLELRVYFEENQSQFRVAPAELM